MEGHIVFVLLHPRGRGVDIELMANPGHSLRIVSPSNRGHPRDNAVSVCFCSQLASCLKDYEESTKLSFTVFS